MNCQDIANLLDSREILELTPDQNAAVTDHLRGCESCASEWRAVRALWEVSTRPPAQPRAGLFLQSVKLATATGARREPRPRRQASFWLGAGIGGAIAASVAVAIVTLVIAPRAEPEGSASGIRIALNEPADVGVAINAGEAMSGAEIRVVLTGGVRLAGFGDQSVVSWRTDLDQGVNRLTLPLIAVTPAGGQVLVEVEHARKRQIFVVDVGVAAARQETADAADVAKAAWTHAAV